MKKLQYPLTATTLFWLFCQVLPLLGASDQVMLCCLALAPLPVLWMLYRILKDGQPAEEDWDDRFYEDHAYRRNGKEETAPPS